MSVSKGILPPGCVLTIEDCERILWQWYEQLKMGVDPEDIRIYKNYRDDYTTIMIINNKVVWNSLEHNLLDGALHPDTIEAAAAENYLIVGNSDPKWDRFPPGPSATVRYLKSDNRVLSWGAIVTSDTKIGTIMHLGGDATKVEPCDKITFIGATVTQDGAAGNNDAFVTINSRPGYTIGLEVDDIWVEVTQTGIVTLDDGNWLGRQVRILCSYFDGSIANAILAPSVGPPAKWWHSDSSDQVNEGCTGSSATGNPVGKPLVVYNVNCGNSTWIRIFVDVNDGNKLKLDCYAYSNRTQVRIWAWGSSVMSNKTLTI